LGGCVSATGASRRPHEERDHGGARLAHARPRPWRPPGRRSPAVCRCRHCGIERVRRRTCGRVSGWTTTTTQTRRRVRRPRPAPALVVLLKRARDCSRPRNPARTCRSRQARCRSRALRRNTGRLRGSSRPSSLRRAHRSLELEHRSLEHGHVVTVTREQKRCRGHRSRRL